MLFCVCATKNKMKLKLYIVPALLALAVSLGACKKENHEDHDHDHDHDHDEEMVDPNYSISIMSPNTADKHIGDTVHLHVNFKSESSKTVHNVNVKIYNKSTNTEVYNKPATAHVHETDGLYELHDNFVLSNENGIEAHTDWVLKAKVWGHDAGKHEVEKTIEFHVHP